MTGRRRHAAQIAAVITVVVCVLAIVAAYALAQVDKHQQGTAAAIAIPAVVIAFGALVWLGWLGRRQ